MKKFIKFCIVITILIAGQAFAQGGLLKVDTTKSKVEWKGNKINESHWGLIKVKSGEVRVNKKGYIKKGQIVVDMASIEVTDIKKEKYKKKLEKHLSNEDFFDTEKYPTSTLVINKVKKKKDGSQMIFGTLEIMGKTNPIQFPVKVMATENGFNAVGSLEVDRTLYGIKYASKKFFQSIGDKFIKDNFELKFNLFTAGKAK